MTDSWGADEAIAKAEKEGTVGTFDDLVKLCCEPDTDALFYVVSEAGTVFSICEDDIARLVADPKLRTFLVTFFCQTADGKSFLGEAWVRSKEGHHALDLAEQKVRGTYNVVRYSALCHCREDFDDEDAKRSKL